MSRQSDFFNAVYDTAIGLGANDVQARLAAAQASQETGFGEHYVGGNLFGIKASDDYAGQSVTAGTNEEYDGQTVRENANFRAYENPLDSVKDYLATIQSNFPDAWSAPTFDEAVKGLNSGVFGSYATDSQYGNKIAAIDNALGGSVFAANPSNVPTPYSPDDQTPDYAVADDVLPMSQPSFVSPNPEFAFAANPENVPAPAFADAERAMAFAPEEAAVQSPFASVLAAEKQPGAWGEINGVGPVYTPTFNQWAPMAEAGPVKAPTGILAAEESVTPAPGILSRAITQEDVDRAFFNPTGAGQFDPSFTEAMMGPQNPVVPTAVETATYTPSPEATADIASSRFATPAKTARIGTTTELSDLARMSPLAGVINPATNIQSFAEEPAVAANQGILAPNFSQAMNPTFPGLSIPSVGVTEPQIKNAIQMAAVPGILAPSLTAPTPGISQEEGYQQLAATAAPAGLTNLSGGNLLDIDLSNNIVPTASYTPTNSLEDGAAPALDAVEVADQPSIAPATDSVTGPATTSATDQQKQAAKTPTTTSKPRSILDGLFSKEAATGGILGGLALGPPGALVGALAGQQVDRAGGLGNMFGSSPMTITNIGSGPAAAYSVWGGGVAPGTQATASDGQTITAMPSGYTAVTGKYGATTVFDNNGKAMSYFGGALGNDEDTEAEAESSSNGGFSFGGFFS